MPRRTRETTTGRPVELPGAWGELARAVGGVSALAQSCGVTPRAVQLWAARARTPGPLVRAHVSRLARRHGVADPWAEARTTPAATPQRDLRPEARPQAAARAVADVLADDDDPEE